MGKAFLIDTTKCVGCRSCQVSCKQWNDLPAEKTELKPFDVGLQNPTTLSAKTFTVVTYHEVADSAAPGGLKYVFAKRQCMHCNDPACVSACPTTAMHKTAEGPVVYDDAKCIGCRYCMLACPFGVPTAQWDSLTPKIRKCTACYDRVSAGDIPACVKSCPTGAVTFGDRGQLIALGQKRIKDNPGQYINHIYGEREAGGTGALYLSSVPFEQIGLRAVGFESFARPSFAALDAVPPLVVGVGTLLGAFAYVVHQRKVEMARQGMSAEEIDRQFAPMQPRPAQAPTPAPEQHIEFAPLGESFWTRFNRVLLVFMSLGAISFLLRFALGLGKVTNLSDTHAWGLWITLNLIEIAGAAGTFAVAALIYILRREDLYPLGRSAVLLGLLSYTFVTITLVADVGLPWHVWQLLVQSPAHSAMFVVSWCIGLYVTILAFEFLPTPFRTLGMRRGLELWRKYSDIYVVLAVTAFVYLMSHTLTWTVLALAVFALLAWVFRTRRGEEAVPVLLALAGTVFATMHESSLGTLFLLMSDKLSHLWWSPVLPVNFFLSAVAGGTALVVLTEMWIAGSYRRLLSMPQLAFLGQVSFWALAAFEAVRLGDLIQRGQLPAQIHGPNGVLFLAEVLVGGLLPLVLLSTDTLRRRPHTLGLGLFFTLAGVVFNRANVVMFAMDLKGPMPQIAPVHYAPSIVEWTMAMGASAATIFIFGYAARRLPILTREQAAGD
jgi:formate dehydrogenase iron-sulfur subunit